MPFANPQFLEQQAQVVFDALAEENYLVGVGDHAEFVDRMAYHLGEVNMLHPFREGNGRAQRQLFREVAAHAGWQVDFNGMDPEENVTASIVAGLAGDHAPLREMLTPLVSPL